MPTTAKRSIASLAYSIFLLVFFALCILNIEALSLGVKRGLSLAAEAVIPTVFPFLILTDLLLSSSLANRLLALLSRPFSFFLRLSPEGGCAFLIGNIFGFPMGAKAVSHYYKNGMMAKKEAERLLLFSGNASPFFLIGSVGLGMLGSRTSGIRLYLIQLSVSFFSALISSFGAKTPPSSSIALSEKKESAPSLPVTIRAAVRASLFICGYIVFFSSLIAVLLPYVKSRFLSCFCAAIFELGTGASYAAEAGGLALSFSAFAASFAGLSVYFQTLDAISDTDLKTTYYLPVKLLCGSAAFFFALFF